MPSEPSRPDAAPSEVECAILFADIAGSTRLYRRLGGIQAQEEIARRLEGLAALVAAHAGVVVKTIGDALMARFATAAAAAAAARDMQQGSELRSPAGVAMEIKIGLHYGAALLQADDAFGDAVNLAARMAELAKAGQIITSEPTVAHLPAPLAGKTRKIDRTRVKGIKGALDIYEILWGREELVTRITTVAGSPSPAARATTLRLRWQGREVVLGPDSPPFCMGRDPQCDLVVDLPHVSRTHATISYRRGRFLLQDESTNGTTVRAADGEELYLHRDRLPLTGEGVIALGKPLAGEGGNDVSFACG
jgi:class 3 adenylate cyclase